MLNGKFCTLACAVALGLSCSSASLASDSPFTRAYRDYQTSVQAGDVAEIESRAAAAYLLGQSIYAKDSLDLTNLALNWATALSGLSAQFPMTEDGKRHRSQAYRLYETALVVYVQHYGEQALELIDPLLGAGGSADEPKDAKRHLEHAIDIAERNDNSRLVADAKMAAFNTLSKTNLYTPKVRNYAFEAYDIYRQTLPENALVRVKATFIVGAIKFSQKQDNEAEALLLEVIKQFDVLDYTHPFALSAHAYLVELYERQDEREKSTRHCIAIGSMRPWSETQEQTPLFRVAPDYPMSYRKQHKNGWVQVDFTVDENGFVTNPVVIASQGGSLFERESLKTIKKWRYAPKFVDGKPSPAQTRTMLEYRID
ncbi:energy transducer TonB [Shewanella salipaludis]|uniref:Energy transducer TonB n=1 Tax=Shewanella salipaludis TaxID=2723052 RepID=A0A972JLW7_9GAMM|nr:energy transducer TonB [Shewanella salipaludis]NMH65887.1 energy transducer TonB [Shewanella salipaludis]